MLSPAPVPQAKPFLAAAAQFAGGQDTPRAYLERCLETLAAWEPKIGAFVCTNIDGSRAAADAQTDTKLAATMIAKRMTLAPYVAGQV